MIQKTGRKIDDKDTNFGYIIFHNKFTVHLLYIFRTFTIFTVQLKTGKMTRNQFK